MRWLIGVVIAAATLSTAGAWIASGTSAAKAHRCPPTSKASMLPKRAGKPLRADIDGDGVRDRITMRTSRRLNCPYFLTVQTLRRAYSIRVPRFYRRARDGREPYVALAVRLAPRKRQIVVVRQRGAATVSVGLYGIPSRRLRLLHLPRAAGDLLSLFGSVTYNSSAICRAGRKLIVLSFGVRGARNERGAYARTDYRLQGKRFIRTSFRQTVRRLRRKPPQPPRWLRKETGKPIFSGCLVAGSSRRLG